MTPRRKRKKVVAKLPKEKQVTSHLMRMTRRVMLPRLMRRTSRRQKSQGVLSKVRWVVKNLKTKLVRNPRVNSNQKAMNQCSSHHQQLMKKMTLPLIQRLQKNQKRSRNQRTMYQNPRYSSQSWKHQLPRKRHHPSQHQYASIRQSTTKCLCFRLVYMSLKTCHLMHFSKEMKKYTRRRSMGLKTNINNHLRQSH